MTATLTSAPAPPAPPAPTSDTDRAEWVRVLLGVALGPLLAGYLVAVGVVAAVTGAAAGTELTATGTLRAGGPVWLAAAQVPLTIDGAPLSVLPLLPTLLLAACVGRAARRAATRLGADVPALAWPVLAAAAGAHAAVGAGLALADPVPRVAVSPWDAALRCGLLGAGAAVVGLARHQPLCEEVLGGLPGALRRGAAAAVPGLAVLVTGGAAVVLAGLLLSAHPVRASYDSVAGDPGGAFGLTLLSVSYLPNAVIAGVSWLAGPGVSVGAVSAAPLATLGNSVPAVPLLAALPDAPAPWWVVLAFALPLSAGALVGSRCRQAHADLLTRLRTLAVAAAVVAVACLVAAAASGGRLGGGPFDPVVVPAGSLAFAALGWTAVAGAAVVLLGSRGAPDVAEAPAVGDGTIDDAEPDDAEAGEEAGGGATEGEATDEAGTATGEEPVAGEASDTGGDDDGEPAAGAEIGDGARRGRG